MDRHYSAAINCNVLLGDILLDDTAAIDYTVQTKRQLYYGYSSRTYEAVARGRSLVVGSLTLNFKAISYLTRAISEDLASKSQSSLGPRNPITSTLEQKRNKDTASLHLNYGLTEESEDAILTAISDSLEKGSYRDTKKWLEEAASDWFDRSAGAFTPKNLVLASQLAGGVNLVISYDQNNPEDPEKSELLSNVIFRGTGKRVDNSRAETSSAPIMERYEFVCSRVTPYIKT